MTTPTVRRYFFGQYVREARELAGFSPAKAASLLDPGRPDVTKINKVERGKIGLKPAEARVLLSKFGVLSEDDVEWLVELARTRSERGRWSGHRASVPLKQRSYYDFEEDASQILTYGVEMMPGLLQHEDYMRCLLESSPRVLAQVKEGKIDIDSIMKTRLERQQLVLSGDHPVDLHFVLSESVLRRTHGIGNAVMHRQMKLLDELSRRPNLRIQILEWSAPGNMFGFTMLKIPAPRANDAPLEIAYVETLHDAEYVDDTKSYGDYSNLWGYLTSGASTRNDSRRTIGHYAQDYA